MIGKRMTPQQRDAYRTVRERGVLRITVETARPLHALKRQGRVRFGTDALGRRVAWPRLSRAVIKAQRRDRPMSEPELDAVIAALAEQEREGIVGKGRVRRRKLHDPQHYGALVNGGWIPPAEGGQR